jgi:hypothetical protein
LSTGAWGAEELPAWSCLDCGNTTVAVEPPSSCGRCMGLLARAPEGLDARFVAAMSPLAAAGWPFDERGVSDRAAEAMLVVCAEDLAQWVMPSAALAVHLAGTVPFSRVAVQGSGASLPADSSQLVENLGRATVRVALAAGTGDVEAGRALVEGLEAPPVGGFDIDELEAGCRACFAEGAPAGAVELIMSALAVGVQADAAERLRTLARPLTAG